MMTMLALLADELTGRGYSMLLSKVARHEDGWIEDLLNGGQADGVILIGQSFEHEAINRAAKGGLAVVAWGEHLADQAYPSVGSDNRLGGLLANRNLLAPRRRRIAFLGHERSPENHLGFRGCRQARAGRGRGQPRR